MALEQMVMEQKTSILLGGFFLFLFFGIKGVFYFILHQLAYVMCLHQLAYVMCLIFFFFSFDTSVL